MLLINTLNFLPTTNDSLKVVTIMLGDNNFDDSIWGGLPVTD